TPGMLDSITERDRGYDYQDVIGDMAQLADLVLVLFDPHKAGTVREAHTSLRETISARTFEDRVLFVLNRIDECSSLSDLLQVYGTLCWNLSQITGRKDIPPIHLTYSSRAAGTRESKPSDSEAGDSKIFLYLLQNQRKKLKEGILDAPRRRLDNLATFIETHSERLDQLLEALAAYRRRFKKFRIKLGAAGILLSFLFGGAAVFAAMSGEILPRSADALPTAAGTAGFILFMLFWFFGPMRVLSRIFHGRSLKHIDSIIPLETQTRKDTWQAVSPVAYRYLEKTGGYYSLRTVSLEYENVHRIYTQGASEVRSALNELSNMKPDQSVYDGVSAPIREVSAESEDQAMDEPDSHDNPYYREEQ
ncbi:MAG: Dynamin family protein, partial [Desulfosalsimonas sp.]